MPIYPEKEHWLGGVYIDVAHRGKGAATRMVSHMVKLVRELGVETLYLQTDDVSGGLYARLGWQPLERLYYIGREVLVMENAIGDRK
jgi:GNAT superfamily N-acetyltransferase